MTLIYILIIYWAEKNQWDFMTRLQKIYPERTGIIIAKIAAAVMFIFGMIVYCIMTCGK